MRNFVKIVLVMLVLLLVLSACGGPPKSYIVERYGRTFTVDTENSTIACGIDTYNYQLSKYGLPYELKIYYPNGSSYWWVQSDGSGHGGWSDNYSSEAYVSGELLRWALESGFPEDRSDKIMLCFLLLMFAIVHILAPIGMWSCYFGMYREGEPPETELWGIRLLGVLIILGTAAWFWDCI